MSSPPNAALLDAPLRDTDGRDVTLRQYLSERRTVVVFVRHFG